MIRLWQVPALLVTAVLPITAQSVPALNPLLARHDSIGSTIAYHMHATNQRGDHLIRYDADASGIVTRDSAGHRIDALVWRRLVANDTVQQLRVTGPDVEQRLGFAPGFLVVPDLAHSDPRLTAPILDLFSFYVDWWFAARTPALSHPGDHVHISGRGSNSWANGPTLPIASDAVDFDVTLESIDSVARRAVIDVQHLPPDTARVALLAAWMQPRLGSGPNNWVQLELRGGQYVAAVGRETFDDRVVIDLDTGEIVSATMDNPVDVLERVCTDRALTQCGAPNRYRIVRRIEVTRTSGQALPADSLFDRLAGHWVLRGTIAQQATVHDVTFDWLLGREYLQMHEVSRERAANGTAAYEAVVLFGRDPHSGEYAALWLDNTATGAFDPTGTGRGVVAGDSVHFLFHYTPTTSFHTTFIYRRATDAWEWLMDNDSLGVHRPFARATLTRQ